MRKMVLLLCLMFFISLAVNAFALAGTPFNATESLRDVRSLVFQFAFVTKILVFLLVLGIALISLNAFRKKKSTKLLLVSLAFWIFTAKWAFKVLDLSITAGYFTEPIENLMELGLVIVLYLALFKKK